jgi:serine/threonine-protein phosphatase 2A regulatory subunit B''
MENGTFVITNNINIDATVRTSVRYNLVHKMMEENFSKWLSQPNTMTLITKLIEDCKKPNISLSTPSPIFVTRPNNLTQSQAINQQYSFMPPVSPSNSTVINFNNEKRNMLTESQILKDDKRKITESMTLGSMNTEGPANSATASENLIPKFYFGENFINEEIIQLDERLINSFFTKEELTLDEFIPITEEFLGFPKMFNSVLFKKIQPEGTKISKKSFIKFHKENFQGKDEFRKFFNFVKQGNNNFLCRTDFLPFMKSLLEYHPGLEFLKSHPDFQEKYSDIVTLRIFFTCDLNDDGRITFREFRKSNILQIFRKVCEESDINKVRDYFSYEHFYVLYCLFWDLDGNEHDFLLDKEDFSKYDGHSLSRKAVDRIFTQIPRKFKSGQSDKMGFEDFVWYLLCEEDKTTRTSIEYWFKVIDLDNNGIIT